VEEPFFAEQRYFQRARTNNPLDLMKIMKTCFASDHVKIWSSIGAAPGAWINREDQFWMATLSSA